MILKQDYKIGNYVEMKTSKGNARGFITKIYSYNAFGIVFFKSEFPLELNREFALKTSGEGYIIKLINDIEYETLYELMDYALYKRDFKYAAEIYERMYA